MVVCKLVLLNRLSIEIEIWVVEEMVRLALSQEGRRR